MNNGYNFHVMKLKFDKWGPLSKMMPNSLLQHPMSSNPPWLLTKSYEIAIGGSSDQFLPNLACIYELVSLGFDELKLKFKVCYLQFNNSISTISQYTFPLQVTPRVDLFFNRTPSLFTFTMAN